MKKKLAKEKCNGENCGVRGATMICANVLKSSTQQNEIDLSHQPYDCAIFFSSHLLIWNFIPHYALPLACRKRKY